MSLQSTVNTWLKPRSNNSSDADVTMYQDFRISKELIHKLSIAIASGLIGFCLNLHPFVFLLPEHQFIFMPGLVFPMMVSLNLGWRYGLLSATFGVGCQTLWAKGGWESIVTLVMLVLWIAWHGWCAGRLRSTGETKWNRYVAEIPFRIFNIIILYTIFTWTFQFNPPSWAPAITKEPDAISHLNITALEGTVNGYLILLLSNVLIIFGPFRKLFRLKEIKEQKRANYLLGTCFLIACAFWVIDGIYCSYLLGDSYNSLVPRSHERLIDKIVFEVPSHALLERISFFAALLIGATLSAGYMNKHLQTDKMLRKLVELSPYPITTVDCHDRIENINPEFVESFGYTLADIPTVTEWYRKIFPNIFDRREFANSWKEDIENAKKTKTEQRMYKVLSKDGNMLNIIFRQVVFNEERKYIICENVSERVRAEQEFRKLNEELEQRVMQRTAQLEATNKELEAFSYSVSHDLRAPLRSIDGFSLALMEEYEDRLDAEGKDYLGRVRSASQRMGQIIEDLLSLSRISRRELRKEQVDLSAIAERIVAKLRESAPDRSTDVVIAPRITGNCDPNLIEVVLENLLSNAWKFTSKKERPWIIFEAISQNGDKVYRVRDNGAGFDMAYADKLFGAFQRLHKHTDFEGYGIGLATVMRIINRHGGRIWAEGYVDQGASFYFVL
jgi:PAS domain S-box-containing protein